MSVQMLSNIAITGQNGMKLDFCPVNDLTLKKSYFVPCNIVTCSVALVSTSASAASAYPGAQFFIIIIQQTKISTIFAHFLPIFGPKWQKKIKNSKFVIPIPKGTFPEIFIEIQSFLQETTILTIFVNFLPIFCPKRQIFPKKIKICNSHT